MRFPRHIDADGARARSVTFTAELRGPLLARTTALLNLHEPSVHLPLYFSYKSITVAVFVGWWWCGGGAVTSTMIMTWMAEDVVVPVTVGVLNFNRFRAT